LTDIEDMFGGREDETADAVEHPIAVEPAREQAAATRPAAPSTMKSRSSRPEDEARRLQLLRGQRRGLLRLYVRGKLTHTEAISKMIAYDRRLNGGEVSVEGTLTVPLLVADMIKHNVQRASRSTEDDASAAPDAKEHLPTMSGAPSTAELADHLAWLTGNREDGAQARGIGAGDGANANVGEKPPAAGSGGAKKTSGAKDLVETYGTVDDVSRKRLTVDIPVHFVDGLKRSAKGKKIPEERDDVDELKKITKTTPVHTKVAPLFREIFAAIDSSGDWKNILEHPWAYNPRQNRNNASEWSIHSWGTAIDVNATTNPNDGSGATDRQQEVARHFLSRGFTWLQHSDAMHFQYHDGSAPRITDEEVDAIKAGKHKGTSARSLTKDVAKSLAKAKAKLAREKKKKKPRRVAMYEARVGRLELMLEVLTGQAASGNDSTAESKVKT
jgi:hypothetical protein